MRESQPRNIGYMRVSTPEQRTDRQTIGLKDLCDTLYMEQVSAVAKRRPVFEQALADLKQGDSFLVWDLDRAFRSTVDAVTTAESLRKRKITFKIVQLSLDTSTPQGEFFYTMTAAMAQLERRMISVRTKEGMAAARLRGKIIGRPRLLDERAARLAHNCMINGNTTLTEAAAILEVSRPTLTRAFKRAGLHIPRKAA